MQRISRFRMIVFIVIILAMIGVFSLRLYKTQAVVTEESLVAADADSMTYQSTVEARAAIFWTATATRWSPTARAITSSSSTSSSSTPRTRTGIS